MTNQLSRRINAFYRHVVPQRCLGALWGAMLPLMLLLLTACGNDGTFRINGQIENFGTGNLRVVYYADGAVQSVNAPAVDGKFAMTGRIDKPVLARIYTGNGVIAGRLIARPGETIEATFNISDPSAMSVSGDDDSERLAKFLKENSDAFKSNDADAINRAIDKYVRDNRSRLASGVLMADFYRFNGYERQANELIGLLDDKVTAVATLNGTVQMLQPLIVPADSLRLESMRLYCRGDSLQLIDPRKSARTLVMITDASSRRSDSVKAALSVLARDARSGRLLIADISCDPDTASWLASLKSASASAKDSTDLNHRQFPRLWSPAPFNILSGEAIPAGRQPWFVVADSTGTVHYCGPSVSAARDAASTATR